MPEIDVRQILEKTPPDNIALLFRGKSYSYHWLDRHSQRLANGIQKTLKPGEILAIWLPNSPELVSLYIACLRCGILPMPVHRDMRGREIRKILDSAGSRVMITSQALLDSIDDNCLTNLDRIFVTGEPPKSSKAISWNTWLKEPPAHSIFNREGDCPAFILCTSGSEGQPKGVVLSCNNLKRILEFRLAQTAVQAGSISVVGSCLTQSVGLHQVLAMLAAGGFTILFEDYNIDLMVRAINQFKPTHLIMVVNAFHRLLQHPCITRESFERIVFASAGADRITAVLQQNYISLTGKPLNVTYGMTESSWVMVNNHGRTDKALSIGKPGKDVEVRLINESGEIRGNYQVGEIQIHSPRTMSGYLNDPALTRSVFSGKWLASGDLAYRDDDGFYWFVGRKKALIVRNTGDLVSPVEIEQAIAQIDHIVDSLVVTGHLEEDNSEVPIAFVIADDASLSEGDLLNALAKILSPHKLPYRVHFVTELPAGPTGKVIRNACMDRHESPLAGTQAVF